MVTEAAPLVFRYSVRKYRVLPESRISSTMMMSRPLMSRWRSRVIYTTPEDLVAFL